MNFQTETLPGFADCNDFHHDNSARFGWRWLDGQIGLFVYCYVNGERIFEQIGSTQPYLVNDYQIHLLDNSYVFYFDGKKVSIPRKSKCETGEYYLLFPYFGGDETAPHDIMISIRRN